MRAKMWARLECICISLRWLVASGPGMDPINDGANCHESYSCLCHQIPEIATGIVSMIRYQRPGTTKPWEQYSSCCQRHGP